MSIPATTMKGKHIMFVNKIVIGVVSAALLVSGPAQVVAQAQDTVHAEQTADSAQGVQKITVSDDPFVTPAQGVTGRGFDLRWDVIQEQAEKAGIDASLCGTDTREREANVVARIGATDDGVQREYYAVTNSTGQLVEVIAREIVVQNDDTETVTDDGRYCKRLPYVPGAGKSFDRGHVIADSLGGESNLYNLTPQNSTLNRYGDQAFIEDQIRKAGGAADFHAVITYPDAHSDVPSRYSIAYSLEDTPRVRTFANIDPDSAGPEDAYEVVSPTDDMYELEFSGDESDRPAGESDILLPETEQETAPEAQEQKQQPGTQDHQAEDVDEDMAVTGSSSPWVIALGAVLAVLGLGAAAFGAWRVLAAK